MNNQRFLLEFTNVKTNELLIEADIVKFYQDYMMKPTDESALDLCYIQNARLDDVMEVK